VSAYDRVITIQNSADMAQAGRVFFLVTANVGEAEGARPEGPLFADVPKLELTPVQAGAVRVTGVMPSLWGAPGGYRTPLVMTSTLVSDVAVVMPTPPEDGRAFHTTETAEDESSVIEGRVRRLVAEGRVQDARAMIGQATLRGLHSKALSEWREVLAPARVRLRKTAKQRPRDREQRWLSQHESEYSGQWVALNGEVLVAAGDDLRRVIEDVRGLPSAEDVIFCLVPKRASE